MELLVSSSRIISKAGGNVISLRSLHRHDRIRRAILTRNVWSDHRFQVLEHVSWLFGNNGCHRSCRKGRISSCGQDIASKTLRSSGYFQDLRTVYWCWREYISALCFMSWASYLGWFLVRNPGAKRYFPDSVFLLFRGNPYLSRQSFPPWEAENHIIFVSMACVPSLFLRGWRTVMFWRYDWKAEGYSVRHEGTAFHRKAPLISRRIWTSFCISLVLGNWSDAWWICVRAVWHLWA